MDDPLQTTPRQCLLPLPSPHGSPPWNVQPESCHGDSSVRYNPQSPNAAKQQKKCDKISTIQQTCWNLLLTKSQLQSTKNTERQQNCIPVSHQGIWAKENKHGRSIVYPGLNAPKTSVCRYFVRRVSFDALCRVFLGLRRVPLALAKLPYPVSIHRWEMRWLSRSRDRSQPSQSKIQ